ncbi:MAG: NUDIX domain-containing protein [Bacteroidales bacterium]
MIKIYFKNRFISLSKEKTDSESADIQTLDISASHRLKLGIKSFIDKPEIKELNIYGDNQEKLLEKIKHEFKIITAGGGLVKGQSGRNLFIFRRGKWDLPKGKAEEGESNEECALREVSEECTLEADKLKIADFLCETFHIYQQEEEIILKQTFWYDMIYLGEESCVEPQTEEDIEECFWAKESEISELMKNSYATIRDFVLAD